MKRIVSFLIVISICLMLCAPVFAAGESSPITVTLTAYCELNGTSCDIEKISGIYLDNNFYVEPEILASITGYYVEEKSERGARLLSHNRIRPSVVVLSEDDCIKTYIGDDTVITPCPVQNFDGKPYVSFVHFMNYVGASFAFFKDQPIQLITIKHYDIFDAIADMGASEEGYRFTWDEIDYGKDINDILFNAGLVAILGEEGIHPIKILLNPDSVHEGILENILLTIVSTDCGSSTYFANSPYQVLYDTEELVTLGGSCPDYLEVYSQNIPSGGSSNLVKRAIGITSPAADTIINVMQGIEISQRYDALIDEERTILQDTIVRFSSQLSDIVMENNDDFKYIINAATDVSVKAQDNAERNARIRNKIFEDFAIDTTVFVAEEASNFFDPFTTAINGAISVYKVLPGTSGIIDKKTMLWNAYCSSVVQDLAFSIYANHTTTWYQWDKVQEAVGTIKTSDSIIGKLFSNYQMMDREDLLMYLKKALLLQLRSTFITRQYLIASGSLDEKAVNIQNKVCSYISELYYKISSCTIPTFNSDDLLYTVDLSWMATDSAKPTYDLVVDAYVTEYTNTESKYDAETGDFRATEVVRTYRIPQINLSSTEIQRINSEIYNSLFRVVEDSISTLKEYDSVIAGSNGVSYHWSVNGDILSLVITDERLPDYGGVTTFMVYNISISSECVISKEAVIEHAGYSADKYTERCKQVFGSCFWNRWGTSNEHFQNESFIDLFNQSLCNTIATENISKTRPYLNDDGELCVIALVYTMAGSGLEYYDVNLEKYEILPYATEAANLTVPKEDEAELVSHRLSPGSAPEVLKKVNTQ